MHYRSAIKLLIDCVLWSLSLPAAYFLRLEFEATQYAADIFQLMLMALPVKVALILFNGLHNSSWRYSSFSDARRIIHSILQFTLIFYLLKLLAPSTWFIPLSVPAIEAMLSVVAFLFVRITCQVVFREARRERLRSTFRKPHHAVLIAGAGEAGTMIMREMLRHPSMGMTPAGFVDDDPAKQNQLINGVPVLGTVMEMSEVFRKHTIHEVVIAMPSASGEAIRLIVEHARAAKVNYRIIPGLHELISRKVSINQLRDVQLEDLLGRKPVELDSVQISQYITGRRVMVTGAGGSIGSEIVRQITSFNPKVITLVGRGENSLHQLMLQMERQFPQIPIEVKVCDVRDIVTLESVFEQALPEVIFHASAHKHVRLMELNPAQAIFNNVFGTQNVVNLALQYGVSCLVNVSTDKAINPTSVMGASKRVTELVVQWAAKQAKEGQQFVSVRFGNVLGSRGSVVPIFKEQIRQGGPITITHPDMVRYFMTIPEASQLVLQAGAMRANGAVFVLKMGAPVRILDMAHDLIRLSGLEPDKDIHIVFTGMAPGEKMFEELLTEDENNHMTPHEKIMISRHNDVPDNLPSLLDGLFHAAESGDSQAIKKALFDVVPSYQGYDAEAVTVNRVS